MHGETDGVRRSRILCRLCLFSLSALGSVLLAFSIVDSAEAAIFPGLVSSAPPPGIRVYGQGDVDCDRPRYLEASPPFERMEISSIHSQSVHPGLGSM